MKDNPPAPPVVLNTPPNDFNNILQVGFIVLKSPVCSMNDLVKTLKKLLRDEDIKKYLEILKKNQQIGGYVG